MGGHRLLTAVVAGLLTSAAQLANAADLAVPAPIAPAFSWTGCYAGAQLGGGALQDGYTAAANPSVIGPSGSPSSNLGTQWGFGVLGGAQLGCNYQIGHFVVGIESDAWGSSLETQSNVATFGHSGTANASTTNPYDFDLAGRFGIAYDEAFFYGKAGLAVGGFNYNYTSFYAAQSGTSTSPGVLIGLGIEYAIWSEWTVKFETDFLLFSSPNVNLACTGCTSATSTISNSEVLFKLGVNYKFY